MSNKSESKSLQKEIMIFRYRKFLITFFYENLKLDYGAFAIDSKFKSYSVLVVLKRILNFFSNEQLSKLVLISLLEEFLDARNNDIVIKSNQRLKNLGLEAIENLHKLKNELQKQNDNLGKLYNKIYSILRIIYNELNLPDLKHEGFTQYTYSLIYLLNDFISFDLIKEEYIIEEKFDESLSKLELIGLTLIDLFKNYYGYSRKYLDYLRENHLDTNKVKIEKDDDFWLHFKKFTNLLRSREKEYIYYFKISFNRQSNKNKLKYDKFENIIKNFLYQFEIKTQDVKYFNNKLEKISEKFKDKFKVLLDKEGKLFDIFVGIKDKGVDIHAKLYEVMDKFYTGIDILLSEFNALTLEINPIVIVEKVNSNEEDKFFLVDTSFTEYLNRKKGDTLFLKKLNIILSSEKIYLNLKETLKRSIRYYRISLNSKNLESKYLNLWIALETLFLTEETKNIFEKVSNNVKKIIILNYLKHKYDLYLEFIEHRKKKEEEFSKKKGKRFNQYTKIYEKMLELNKDKLNIVGLLKLFFECYSKEDCLDNIKYFKEKSPFYYFYFLKEARLFNMPKENKNLIGFGNLFNFLFENLSRNIKFKLSNLYLYRNFIVHTGYKGTEINNLLFDLEFIYILVLNDIVAKINYHKISPIISIDEYIGRLDRTFEHYKKMINPDVKKRKLRIEDILFPKIVL